MAKEVQQVESTFFVLYSVTEYTLYMLTTVIRDVKHEIESQGGKDEADSELNSALTCLCHAHSKLEDWVPEHQAYLSDEHGNPLEVRE